MQKKTEPLMTPMEQWSIFSNVLNYVLHSKFNSMNYTLNVKAMNRYKVKPDRGREFKELDFGLTPQKLQEEYLDVSCRSLVFSGTVHWFVGRQAFIHYCGLHQV